MAALDGRALRGWTPVRIASTGNAVDWAIVDGPFTEPFFEQTADRAMRHPFNAVFARTTPRSVLDDFADEPGAEPAGFVFHMSRCGSTLIAQMIARLESALVLSEAQPFDALLRAAPASNDRDDALLRSLRGAVRALAANHPDRRPVVKFHAWHVLRLPALARAFPAVPWAFVFREPRAVLRSQERAPGAEVSGALDPAHLGVELDGTLQPLDSTARVLAVFCEAALRHAAIGRALFLDYETLPEAVFSRLLPFFGLAVSPAERDTIREVAARDPKRDGGFSAEAFPKADRRIDELASRWLDAPYAALRARATAGV
ncbi:MAG TPA: hypothetical protein VGC96_10130 [Candidatus Elarobacter sp.]|jgi:hypothetical protein